MSIYLPGSTVGQYVIASLPMQGGMGIVYFCFDTLNSGRRVALKTFKPEFLSNRATRDRFLRESTAWVNLGDHPHIVKCYDAKYIDPIFVLSLELIEKEKGMKDASLRSWMDRPISIAQGLLFALQIARGLQYANKKIPGFVHRDLKPENVLVGADKLSGTNVNRLRVTDFGLAIMMKDENGRLEEDEKEVGRTHLTHGIVGTPLYMAPEQWKGEEVGVYTDVYALGCILYEMLMAKRIVDGRSVNDLRSAHCDGKLALLPESMPREIKIFLDRCLSLHPAERYQAWENITRELEQIYVWLVGNATPTEMPMGQVGHDEKIREGHSINEIGLAYKDIGKKEVAQNYFERSLSIAREKGDRSGVSVALINLANIKRDAGEVRTAIGYYEEALAIDRKIGDRRGEGVALAGLGTAHYRSGEVHNAIGYYEQALEIDREIGDRHGEGADLENLGLAYAYLGKTSPAIRCYEQALIIHREIGDRRGECVGLTNLGVACSQLREFRRAIGCLEQALTISHDIGDRSQEGTALGILGKVYADLGETHRAIEYCEQALAIDRETGDWREEGYVLDSLGTAYYRLGKVQVALGYYEQEMTIQHKFGDLADTARISFNMALLYTKQGETSRALSMAQEAEQIWSQIGSPNIQAARQLIAQLQSR